METLTYALLKPIVPFVIIMALAAAGWTLSEVAARRLSGNERTLWALAVLVFPPLGIIHGLMGRNHATSPRSAEGR